MAAASSALTDHLYCCICMEVFTDPVAAACQHTFCRKCLQQTLDSGHQRCPVCSNPIEARSFQTNWLIRDMADELKRLQLRPEVGGAQAERGDVCPAHREVLRLFCETDGQLLCWVCKEGRDHRGHTFKPVEEAQKDLREEVASVLAGLRKDIRHGENTQKIHIDAKASKKQKCDEYRAKINSLFAELHEKLKEMEDNVMEDIKYIENIDYESMSLKKVEALLKTDREREAQLQTGLDLTDACHFLRFWAAEGQMKWKKRRSFQYRYHISPCDYFRDERVPATLLEYIDLKGIKNAISMSYMSCLHIEAWAEHVFSDCFEESDDEDDI